MVRKEGFFSSALLIGVSLKKRGTVVSEREEGDYLSFSCCNLDRFRELSPFKGFNWSR
jgi:hypothetical protein